MAKYTCLLYNERVSSRIVRRVSWRVGCKSALGPIFQAVGCIKSAALYVAQAASAGELNRDRYIYMKARFEDKVKIHAAHAFSSVVLCMVAGQSRRIV